MLEVKDLRVRFWSRPEKYAVDGVSFHMDDGEILGLVGESGSGKSVTAMAISGLLPRRKTETAGSILLDGREMLNADREEVRKIQGKEPAHPHPHECSGASGRCIVCDGRSGAARSRNRLRKVSP